MTTSLDNPLLESLGVRLIHVAPGTCTVELDVEPRHLNRQRTLQGGLSATLLDAACGYAGLQQDNGAPGNAVTLMLSICYLGKVSAGRVRATATVTRAGRRIYFSSAELVSDTGECIATAQGTFQRAQETSSC
ncbi:MULTISPECIES: PaaI family thioesterase [unclassified Cupriavidus]|uniref:PaaI family thioesterase n=1 Tax=Cupriavidus sp. H19C3 TaxID=3241603 RepID=UPI003BF7A6EA